MLPNPFQKQLPEFKDTDPLKNREIVRELLGPEGVHKYRKILGDTSDPTPKQGKEVSKEELLALAAEARSKTDHLSQDAFRNFFEKHIEDGYDSQIKSLQEINFLETKDGKRGITAIDKKFYEIPSVDAIKDHFRSIPNIRLKMNQGFTRLLIVPFGSSLNSLREKTGELIKKHKQENKLLAEDGTELELNKDEPIYALGAYGNTDKSGTLIYYPERFDRNNHNGRTKTELLSAAAIFPGYHILLIQENPIIPRKGKGTARAGREQIEGGMSPREYLELLKTDPTYSNEQGMTPEDWLTLFATNLNQKNKVINDWQPHGDCSSYLIGSYLPDPHNWVSSDHVPNFSWRRDGKLASMDSHYSGETFENSGATSAVG